MSNSEEELRRTCPFPDCDWSYNSDYREYTDSIQADFEAERHYEQEHAGRVRVHAKFSGEQMMGERDAQEISDWLHDRLSAESLPGGLELSFTAVEVIEEADEHPGGGQR